VCRVHAGAFFPYVASLSVLIQVVALPIVGAIADRSDLVAAVTFGAALVFANAFLPDIAAPEERDSVSSRGWALGYLGGGVLLGLNLLLVFHAAEPSSPSRYTSWPAPVV